MARILAQADIGNHDEIGYSSLDPANRLLDNAIDGVGTGPHLILDFGQAKEKHCWDPQFGDVLRLFGHEIFRQTELSRQRFDLLLDVGPVGDEERIYQVRHPQGHLSDHAAQGARSAQAAHP
jgi:hypothetical protein